VIAPGTEYAEQGENLGPFQAPSGRQLPRIAIRGSKGRILFIDLREVISVQAQGNYVKLQRQSASHVLRESISAIAERLKPYGFTRIHRSMLVNGSYVEEIRPCKTGDYALRVKGGREYTVSRSYKEMLRNLAELWIGIESVAGVRPEQSPAKMGPKRLGI
jgi:DNA-binding LytR/AlgR family response regulator